LTNRDECSLGDAASKGAFSPRSRITREGVWHEQEGGVPALEAKRRVIERFGSPRLVARRFAEDLTGGGVCTAARAMLAVSGVADTAFRFQRAEAVPSSPSTLVHAVFAAVRALITAAGGYFVVRAVLRLWSLRRLRTN
jgi:hypothetical protein